MENKVLFTDRAYDMLSWIALILLPAVAGLYFGLDKIWGLWKAAEVVGTISLVDVFLGTLLGVSKVQYKQEPKEF